MIILDTNVLSELLRPVPDEGVLAWLEAQPRSQLFTTAINRAEILYGMALLPRGARGKKLREAAVAIFDEDFEAHILVFDEAAADCYAEIAAHRKNAGKPISQLDAMIAGIAKAQQGRLGTRNTKDFVGCGIDLLDPWSQ